MAKVRYYYDLRTSQYKRYSRSVYERITYSLKLFSLSLVLAFALIVTYDFYYELPSEARLSNEVKHLESNYVKINNELNSLSTLLTSLEERDDKVYRAVLGVEPIDNAIRSGGIGGVERYSDIRKQNFNHGETVISIFSKLDNLKRKIAVETNSQVQLLEAAETKQKQFAAIPAIQPISNRQLKALASGFGNRIHPVYKVLKMHTGIDFASPIGTPVYATAEGVIEIEEVTLGGYGKTIIIDHGFGYKTRYAHLHDFAVAVGKKVKRGEQIGYVGNTGVSTAPHLHYEVLLNGKHINPIHYFFNDLNSSEYEKITALASIQNQSLGN